MSEEISKQVTTTSRPWPQHSRGNPGSSYEYPRYNHTYNGYNHHGQGYWNTKVQPTITTESSGLPWRPTRIPMIQKPDYNHIIRIPEPNGYQQSTSTSRNTEETSDLIHSSHYYNPQINIDESEKQQSSNTTRPWNQGDFVLCFE